MAPLLTIAGVGTSMVFPAVANEVMASVAPNETGIASGTNSALRELGGVFGVAVLASVFSRPDVYSSPDTFVAGFRSALWIAVGFSAAGIFLALSRKRASVPKPEPAIALGGTADNRSDHGKRRLGRSRPPVEELGVAARSAPPHPAPLWTRLALGER